MSINYSDLSGSRTSPLIISLLHRQENILLRIKRNEYLLNEKGGGMLLLKRCNGCLRRELEELTDILKKMDLGLRR